MKIPQIKDSRETVKKIKPKNFHIQITEKNHLSEQNNKNLHFQQEALA